MAIYCNPYPDPFIQHEGMYQQTITKFPPSFSSSSSSSQCKFAVRIRLPPPSSSFVDRTSLPSSPPALFHLLLHTPIRAQPLPYTHPTDVANEGTGEGKKREEDEKRRRGEGGGG
jgi:hypothetical protein